MRVMLAAMAIVLALGAWILKDQGVKGELRQSLTTANQTIQQKEQVIIELNKIKAAHEKAQNELVEKIGDQQQLLQVKNREWENLKRENATLRAWADLYLPDPVRRMRQRPAIATTADYRQWMSGSDAVQPASQQPNHQ